METREELRAEARQLGVTPEPLEKVVRLLDILRRLEDEKEIAGRFALKGGSALNLFWLELPRLSVDIDLDFIHDGERNEAMRLRPDFEGRVERCIRLAGCQVMRMPREHAGGKLRLRFASLFGGQQNLEVDLNFVARVPIFGLVRRACVLPRFATVGVSTYELVELAAGKFVALVGRSVARDQFDAVQLLDREPGLLDDGRFRICFTALAAAAADDVRRRGPTLDALSALSVREHLLPVLRTPDGEGLTDATALAARLAEKLGPAFGRLLSFSEGERAFLSALIDRGEIEPEHLTPDADLQGRLGRQPMLRWRRIQARKRLGLPPHPEDGG
ncbi:MAG: nucleotidyl transferase AbiEii/AbiGii toxin family protein [Candidatus Eisenbacteria bacterium]|nr:nucleotidyl transferase AbiEii/AbiGii toxin family protein [Candidatus Eisenbacteria bacterium]